MGASEIQVQFFLHIKSLLPHYKSLVDEIAELLDISNDSAYRRIRGDKLIDLEEIKVISQHFNISLDQVFNLETNAIIFHGKLNSFSDHNFKDWLQDVLKQFQMINSMKNKHIYYSTKDMPPFYQMYFPELASFKFFFWMKSILHNEELKNKKFTEEQFSLFNDQKETCKEVIRLYNQIPTTEIWNEEGINSTVKQIELYHEMGIIPNAELVRLLYSQLFETIEHLEQMAEKGTKFHLGKQPQPENAPYNMYINEYVIGDNTFFAEIDNLKITYLNHSVLYFIGSMDPKFNDAMFRNLDNLIKKSTLISNTGEKERNRFFHKLKTKITEKLSVLV